MDKPPWYIYIYMIWDMHVTYSINLATPGQWNASMLGTPYRENWPKAVRRRQMNARIQRRIYWEKHMGNGDHLASLTTVALCLTVCWKCVLPFFLLNEFVDNCGGLAELNALVADLASLKSCSTCTDWALDGLAPLFRGAFLSTCARNKSGTSRKMIPTLQKMTKNPLPGYHMLPYVTITICFGCPFFCLWPMGCPWWRCSSNCLSVHAVTSPYLSCDTTIYDYMT